MLDAFAALTQALLYAGIIGACGGVLAAATLRVSGAASQTLARVVRCGAVLTIFASLASLLALILRLGTDIDASILSAVFTSNVGAAAALRCSGGVLLLITPGSNDDSFGRGMHVSAAALVIASFVFSGHAAAEGFGSGLVAALHVAVAAWWVGSLIAMRAACVRSDAEAVPLVRRFSSIAVAMIAGLVAAGSVLIIVLVDITAIEFTEYVRNLTIKVVIAACVLAIAAYNKFALTTAVLAGDAAARGKLKWTIDRELALIGLVLIATAVLTTYSAPHGQ
jgi:putative copper export protein